jgi:hypothetical protein
MYLRLKALPRERNNSSRATGMQTVYARLSLVACCARLMTSTATFVAQENTLTLVLSVSVYSLAVAPLNFARIQGPCMIFILKLILNYNETFAVD